MQREVTPYTILSIIFIIIIIVILLKALEMDTNDKYKDSSSDFLVIEYYEGGNRSFAKFTDWQAFCATQSIKYKTYFIIDGSKKDIIDISPVKILKKNVNFIYRCNYGEGHRVENYR